MELQEEVGSDYSGLSKCIANSEPEVSTAAAAVATRLLETAANRVSMQNAMHASGILLAAARVAGGSSSADKKV